MRNGKLFLLKPNKNHNKNIKHIEINTSACQCERIFKNTVGSRKNGHDVQLASFDKLEKRAFLTLELYISSP